MGGEAEDEEENVCFLVQVQINLEQQNLGYMNLGQKVLESVLIYALGLIMTAKIWNFLEVQGLGSLAFTVSDTRYWERCFGSGWTVWEGVESI